jgi:hypothetical protein
MQSERVIRLEPTEVDRFRRDESSWIIGAGGEEPDVVAAVFDFGCNPAVEKPAVLYADIYLLVRFSNSARTEGIYIERIHFR